MPIFRGTNSISKIFRGDTEIIKAFRGEDLIFSSAVELQYELIADIEPSVGTTQIEISGLNITSNDELRLIYDARSNTTGGDVRFGVCINDNLTDSDYTKQRIFTVNDNGAQRDSVARIVLGRFNRAAKGEAIINLSEQGHMILENYYVNRIGNEVNSAFQARAYIMSNFTVNEINKITIRTTAFNSGPLTRFQLFKAVTS